MDVKDIIVALRREKNLDEASASEQAYAMLATVKGKHPRLKLTAIVNDGQITTLCLENGTQVKFDPSFPVPVWKYHDGARTTDPKRQNSLIFRSLDRIDGLERKALFARSEAGKQEAREAIATIVKQCGASSVDELRKRVFAAALAERGED
jgi:hypothetical protein